MSTTEKLKPNLKTKSKTDNFAVGVNWSDTFINPTIKTVVYNKLFTLTLKYVIKMDESINKSFVYYELETNNLNHKDNKYKKIHYHHPFSGIQSSDITLNKETNRLIIGGINANNKITVSLLEMIMMDDNTLQNECGNVDALCYRSHLVKILYDLWD